MQRIPKNIVFGVPAFLASFILCAALLYGAVQLVKTPEASADVSSTAPGSIGGAASLTLVARDLKFDKGQIAVSAGADVTLTFDNQDAGVQHNISIFPSNRQTSPADRIGGIDPFAGPGKKDVKFTAPARAGSYFFRCDVHPDTMSGQLKVQ